MDDKCKECGEDSTIGAHGVRAGDVYDEYYCDECWGKK
jgi:hypothetical protein